MPPAAGSMTMTRYWSICRYGRRSTVYSATFTAAGMWSSSDGEKNGSTGCRPYIWRYGMFLPGIYRRSPRRKNGLTISGITAIRRSLFLLNGDLRPPIKLPNGSLSAIAQGIGVSIGQSAVLYGFGRFFYVIVEPDEFDLDAVFVRDAALIVYV